MITLHEAAIIQGVLLGYHQLTTWVDLYPFNGIRNYTSKERFIEAGVNAVLMGLPVVGFALGIRSLMKFGVIYYPILFAMELVIWWIPYFAEPRGSIRRPYNLLLSLATSNFGASDALSEWTSIYQRIYPGTLTVVPFKEGRIVPNLEHTILHVGTFATVLVTLAAFAKT